MIAWRGRGGAEGRRRNRDLSRVFPIACEKPPDCSTRSRSPRARARVPRIPSTASTMRRLERPSCCDRVGERNERMSDANHRFLVHGASVDRLSRLCTALHPFLRVRVTRRAERLHRGHCRSERAITRTSSRTSDSFRGKRLFWRNRRRPAGGFRRSSESDARSTERAEPFLERRLPVRGPPVCSHLEA